MLAGITKCCPSAQCVVQHFGDEKRVAAAALKQRHGYAAQVHRPVAPRFNECDHRAFVEWSQIQSRIGSMDVRAPSSARSGWLRARSSARYVTATSALEPLAAVRARPARRLLRRLPSEVLEDHEQGSRYR